MAYPRFPPPNQTQSQAAPPPPPTSSSSNMQRGFTPGIAPMLPFSFNELEPPTPAYSNTTRPPAPPMMSFSYDYSKPLTQQPASANFSLPSAASVAFSIEKRRITVQPLKTPYCSGYVVHQDPAFRRDVFELFGHAYPTVESETRYFNQADVPPEYKAADDDLAVWRAGRGAEGGVKPGGEGDDKENMVKSLEDKSKENLLGRLRYKLFNE
ncbi:hypothetical protein G6011_02964 [Alternaria panax]|uniref:Uncharacterized protein n=1 Tax=Alternaria panax TaxID=48097 RepID=A0AAD4FCR8_9PLEO|nr:hypothetical protein G6011_02964 [Alternaria panax]